MPWQSIRGVAYRENVVNSVLFDLCCGFRRRQDRLNRLHNDLHRCSGLRVNFNRNGAVVSFRDDADNAADGGYLITDLHGIVHGLNLFVFPFAR